MPSKSHVSGPVALKNVAAFMTMTTRVIERDPNLPGMVVCSGHSGLGKSWASVFAQNKTGAVRVEIGDSWTRRYFLQALLRELGGNPKARAATADLAAEVIGHLGSVPGRPLIIDEADKAVDKGYVDIIRELHEHSGAPVILIGEEKLPAKLLGHERVHNRVLDWMQAQPCDPADTALLARAFAPKITLQADLLDAIREASLGRARRIVVNVSRVAELALNKGLLTVDLKAWGATPFYTGEPPAVRHVEPFKRARTLREAA